MITVRISDRAVKFLTGTQREVNKILKPQSARAGAIVKKNIEKEIKNFAKRSTGRLAKSFEVRVKRVGKTGVSF